MNQETKLEKAREFTKKLHNGQKRYNGEDYFAFIQKVEQFSVQYAENMIKMGIEIDMFALRISAIFHNSIESNKITRSLLTDFLFEDMLYIPEKDILEIAKFIDLLTKKTLTAFTGETYYEHIYNIVDQDHNIPFIVKIAELSIRINEDEEGSCKDIYRLSRHILTKEFINKNSHILIWEIFE